MTASAEDAGQSEDSSQRQTRGQGRRGTRQNTARESVQEQEDSGVQPEPRGCGTGIRAGAG